LYGANDIYGILSHLSVRSFQTLDSPRKHLEINFFQNSLLLIASGISQLETRVIRIDSNNNYSAL